MSTFALYLILAILGAIWDSFIVWSVVIAFFWAFWKKFFSSFNGPKGKRRKTAEPGRHTAAANWDHLTD